MLDRDNVAKNSSPSLSEGTLPKVGPLLGPEPATKPDIAPAPSRPETEPQIKPFTFPGEPKPAQRPDPNRTYPACTD